MGGIKIIDYTVGSQIGSWGLASQLLDKYALVNNGKTQYSLHSWIMEHNSGKDTKTENIYESDTVLKIPKDKIGIAEIIGKPVTQNNKQEKIPIKRFLVVSKIEGPDEVEYGAIEDPAKPTVFKNYIFQATAFNESDITDEEKANIRWQVRINYNNNELENKVQTLTQCGETLELEITYEYLESEITVSAYFEDTSRIAQKTLQVPFSVRSVPEILKKLNRKEFDKAIETQRVWFKEINAMGDTSVQSIFNDDQTDIDRTYYKMMTMDEIFEEFPVIKTKFDETTELDWINKKLLNYIRGKIKENNLLGKDENVYFTGFLSDKEVESCNNYFERINSNKTVENVNSSFDDFNDVILLNMLYVQRVDISVTDHMGWLSAAWGSLWNSIEFDDFIAALANCALRIAVKGVIEPAENNSEQVFKILEYRVFFRDGFDFTGEQAEDEGLGHWRANPPGLKLDEEDGYTRIANETYRDWRTTNGVGYDYLLFSSDYKRFKIKNGKSYKCNE